MGHDHDHAAAFDGMSDDYRRRLIAVIVINATMFVVEMAAGALSGSQALKADALDFFADSVTYAASFAVIGMALRTRSLVALAKGASLFLMALWVLGSTIYRVFVMGLPSAEVMGAVGFLALAANVASVVILMAYKDGDANVRSVWICSRNDAIGKQRLMYDMIALALETDSTRTVTFQLSGMNAVPTIPGVKNDWHNLSHHGKDPAKIEELRVIEEAEFQAFNAFLTRLRSAEEQGQTLLDRTTVLFGSNLGNASSHDWHNLPVIVAGGGFRHGAYVAHDEKNNTPLANLFVTLAQHMGLEIDRFGSSTAESVRGLERA